MASRKGGLNRSIHKVSSFLRLVHIYVVRYVTVAREKNGMVKNIQQRGFASGHPPDY
jgi:hypothetical protein